MTSSLSSNMIKAYSIAYDTKKVKNLDMEERENELLERAKAAGDEPELVMDELSGVTFLDYSDVL